MDEDDLRLFACRPARPKELVGERRRMWNLVASMVGRDIPLYPDMVEQPCDVCGLAILVGPDQQQAIQRWRTFGVKHEVICLFCAAQASVEYDLQDEGVVDIRSAEDALGGDFDPQ